MIQDRAPPPESRDATSRLTPALEMRGISKRFPGVRALHEVNFSAYPGEVHALMGENGAGKSTLMKILAGAYTADENFTLVGGERVRIQSPLESRASGINLIYQELNLARNLTVAENIFMGAEPRRGLLIDRVRMNDEAAVVLERLGASFSPTTSVAELSVAEGQLVEIARALVFKGRVLVMDEPTAALSERETEALFEVIYNLRREGIAIVYISHRMNEVYALADRVTVLRDGEYVGTLERDDISAARVVQMMVGRSLKEFYEHQQKRDFGAHVLEIRGLGDGKKIKPASFTVRAGEILGVAGLVGAGRTELARLIFGADRATSGVIIVNNEPRVIRSPADAIRAGIGYVPENRKEQGIFLEMASKDNVVMNVLESHAKAGVLEETGLHKVFENAVREFAIKVSGPKARAVGLSGGNQQKLLVARWLAIGPKVMILDEPTRGVDVGAKAEIYRIVAALAAKGVAIVFISSELPEIVGMCDRVLVMREGEIVGELDPSQGEEITQENIMAFATGVRASIGMGGGMA
jgi:ribose transport system ATP-binding protein